MEARMMWLAYFHLFEDVSFGFYLEESWRQIQGLIGGVILVLAIMAAIRLRQRRRALTGD
jgi:hypothetical protein